MQVESEFGKLINNPDATADEFVDLFHGCCQIGERIKAAEVLELISRLPLSYEQLAGVIEDSTRALLLIRRKDISLYGEKMPSMSAYRWVRQEAIKRFDIKINKE